MEEVLALSDFSLEHILVADCADIVVFFQFVFGGEGQRIDFGGRCSPLHKGFPTHFGFAPNVEIGVDDHHGCSDGSAAFEKEDPTTVEE